MSFFENGFTNGVFYVLLIWSFFFIKTKMKLSMCYYYLLIKNGRVNFQKRSLSHEVFDRLDATNQ